MAAERPPKNDPTEELTRLRARVAELERKETQFQETEQQFRELFSQSPIALASYDADGRVTHANKACVEMFGGLPDPSPLRGHSFFDSPGIPEKLKESVRKGQPVRYEFEYDFTKVKASNLYPTTKSGIIRLDALITPIRGKGQDRPLGYLAQVQDVTHRTRQEAQLIRVNRTLQARSRSSRALLHAADESEYLQEVCRVIVEECGHKLVWIGLAEEDEGKTVRPVASAGFEEGYIEKLNITGANTKRGRGPTGTAIRTGKAAECKNMLTDPAFVPWRKEALERGYASCVALPLLSDGKALGAITVYGAEPEVFSEAETKLLCELADDLAFGVTTLRLRAAHKAADERLRESEEMFHAIFDKAPAGIALAGIEGNLWETNPAFCRMLGYTPRELRGKSSLEITHPDDRKADEEVLPELIAGKRAPIRVEKRFVRKDGQVVFVSLMRSLCRDAAGKPRFFIAMAEDITARKKAEEALQVAYHELEKRVRDRTAELVKANEGLQTEIVQRRQAENALRESEARLQAIFANATFDIWVRDKDGRCILQNASTMKHWGTQIGMRPEDSALPADVVAVWMANNRRALDGEVVREEVEYVLDGERRSYFSIIAPFRIVDEICGTVGFNLDITDRKRNEESLRQSEETIRALLNATMDAMILIDASGNVLAMNEVSAKRLGKTVGETMGRCIYDSLSPALTRARSARLHEVLRSGQAVRFEDERDGTRLDNVVYPILDSQGKVTRVAICSADITERKRAEEALRENEARFRSMFNDAPTGMTVISQTGRFIHANPAFCKFIGYSEPELLDKTVQEITHPDDQESTSWNMALALKGTPIPRIDKRCLRKNGEMVWGEVSVSLVRRADGTPNYTIAQVLDVTSRKMAEDALRESEERYRALFEDSPVSVVEYDCHRLMEYLNHLKRQSASGVREYLENHPEEADRGFATLIPLHANRAAVTLLKAADQDHLLKNLPSTLCDETRQYFRTAMALVASGKTSLEAETTLCTLTGERKEVWISSSFIPGHANRHPMALVATADLTELHAAQREVVRQKQAIQLQRMETLAATGRLAAGVAHEVNNPLQGIVAQLDLLSAELPANQRDGKRIKLIRECVKKIAKIVESLLRLHRAPEEERTSCLAASVVGSVAELISPQAAMRQIRVEVSITPPDVTVPLSPAKLTQVLLNLILNALDATPSGGVIRIEATQAPEGMLLLVSDTGSGISPEHRSRLFSPFFTTKGTAGTGLGLSVTHSLITEAGGTIDVTDREGGGTTFFIRFPSRATEGDAIAR